MQVGATLCYPVNQLVLRDQALNFSWDIRSVHQSCDSKRERLWFSFDIFLTFSWVTKLIIFQYISISVGINI